MPNEICLIPDVLMTAFQLLRLVCLGCIDWE